jgi:REP element-mobilizing transposase RayT
MPRRNAIVIAYHLVWTAYGTWLPNDPRGSGSRFVASPLLGELGELHYGRKTIQPKPSTVREFYERAEELLGHPLIRFDSQQIVEIAAAFADTIARHAYTCYACAILPDHVHIVIRKHRHRAEEMIFNLQNESRSRLCDANTVPVNHPVWTRGGWKRFLDAPEAVRTVARYVEKNPLKARTEPQKWPFVKAYDGWGCNKRAR